MTVREAAQARGIVNFDSALPQGWVDSVRLCTGRNPVGHFVWSYDTPGLFGLPAPVTEEGERILADYEAGQDHPVRAGAPGVALLIHPATRFASVFPN